MTLTAPDYDRYQRAVWTGLTHYDYDEIVDAAEAWNRTYARWLEAVNSAARAIEATFGTREILLLPQDNDRLNRLLRCWRSNPRQRSTGPSAALMRTGRSHHGRPRRGPTSG
jgi:hypothetical protein